MLSKATKWLLDKTVIKSSVLSGRTNKSFADGSIILCIRRIAVDFAAPAEGYERPGMCHALAGTQLPICHSP